METNQVNTTIGVLDIDADDLLKALRAAAPSETNDLGWRTVEELASSLGLSETTIRKRLKMQIKAGTVEYKSVVRISLLETRYHCNAFRLKVG